MAVLLVPERHQVWQDGRLWEVANVAGGTLRAVITIIDGAARQELNLPYDQDVPALDTRPESDAIDSLVRRSRG